MHTKVINKNNFEDDYCASHHNLTFHCLPGNVDGLESDCAKDQTTDTIRTHQTKFEEGNKTDNEISLITNRSQNESFSTDIPIPTNDAISNSNPTITIPMMFAIVIFVSMLLLTSRLYSCFVQDTNCCRKTHSFQPSENTYQMYETVQNNDNIEALAMATLQTSSLPRSVVHSIESGSIGRLMSAEVNLDGGEGDVKEERPPVPPRNGSKSDSESKQQSTTDSNSDVESQEHSRDDSTIETSSSENEGHEDRSGQETPGDSGHGSFNDLEACLRSEMDTNESVENPAVNSCSDEPEQRMRTDPSIEDLFNSPQYDTLRSKKRKEKQ